MNSASDNHQADSFLAFDIILHVEHDEWEKALPKNMEKWIEKSATQALSMAERPALIQDFAALDVAIVLSTDETVREFNKNYRHKDKATNVLSFAALEQMDPHEIALLSENAQAFSLGDVMLAFETCSKEAHEQGIALKNHVAHLVIHGILHLLGYDHENDHDAERMESLEIKILETLGIENPYRHNTVEC